MNDDNHRRSERVAVFIKCHSTPAWSVRAAALSADEVNANFPSPPPLHRHVLVCKWDATQYAVLRVRVANSPFEVWRVGDRFTEEMTRIKTLPGLDFIFGRGN